MRCTSLSASLFRAEALPGEGERLGQVAPWALPRVHLWLYALICSLGLVAVTLAQLEYADKISVEGVVQHSSRPAAVLSSDTGIVKAMYVKQRALVGAGDALLLIDKRSHGSDGQPHAQIRVDQLHSQKRALLDNRARYVEVRELQHRVLERHLSGLLVQHRTAVGLLDLLQQRVELADENRRKVRRLAEQGWLSATDESNS